MNEIIKSESSVTMSSLELVAFINLHEGRNDLTHANLMARIPKVLTESSVKGGVIQFNDTYIHPQNGQTYPCYKFPKREAALVAMSYSYELQAKVFDRMTELENKSRIPQTYAQALQLAANQAVQIEQQTALIEKQKPAVEFVDRFIGAKGSKCLSDVAKLLKCKPRAFIAQMAADGIIFKRNDCWVPVQRYLDAGYFSMYTGEAQSHAYYQTRVEPKGAFWLATKYGMDKPDRVQFGIESK